MRLAIPDLDQEGQIHQTGIGLINLLGIDLFNSVNQSLGYEIRLTQFQTHGPIHEFFHRLDLDHLARKEHSANCK